MTERSLVLIKPDAVERNLIGNILNQYERNGLEIAEMKMMTASKDLAEKHYAQLKDKPFYEDLITFITRSPVVASIIEGEDGIEKIRTVHGATDPAEARANTIRALYGKNVTENSVHASDSVETADKEIELWFG